MIVDGEIQPDFAMSADHLQDYPGALALPYPSPPPFRLQSGLGFDAESPFEGSCADGQYTALSCTVSYPYGAMLMPPKRSD